MKQLHSLLLLFFTLTLCIACGDSSENTPKIDPDIGKPCASDQSCPGALQCNTTTNLCEEVIITTIPATLNARGTTIITDQEGNIYVAGNTNNDFEGEPNHGGQDIFLMKYTPDFQKVWSKMIGTDKNDEVVQISIDTTGNTYLFGRTGGAFENQTITGTYDIALIKVDPDGKILFERQWGDEDDSLVFPADMVLHENSLYVTGSRGGYPIYGAFLAKIDLEGEMKWLKKYGGETTKDIAEAITIDHNNNIILTGRSRKEVPEEDDYDIFIMKLTINGEEIWSKKLSSPATDCGSDVIVDQSNNIYLAGYSSGSLIESNIGYNDMILVKLDSDGIQLWGKQFGTETQDVATSLIINGNHLYLGGNSNGNPETGAHELLDIVLKKFDLNGTEIWSKQIDTGVVNELLDMAIAPSGTLHLTGYEKDIDDARDEDLLIYSLTE